MSNTMRYKNKITAVLIVAICFQACGTMKRNLQSGINAVTDRRFIVPMAVSQSLEEASRSVYSNESLKDGTSVLVETFNVKFYNRQDSFRIHMVNISFYRMGDSAFYQHFNFPGWDINKYADTMRSVFDYSYRIAGATETKCISGEYSIKSGKIEKITDYKPYMQ